MQKLTSKILAQSSFLPYNLLNNMKLQSFTLVELIVVIGIIVILATILIATLNPAELLKKVRDTRRVTDLNSLDRAFYFLSVETDGNFDPNSYASSNTVYISLKDSSSTCGSWLSQLPSLPPGWSYRCSNNPSKVDGTGWIPIPFSNFPNLELARLPIDPLNKPPYYYAFVVGGSYEITAGLEFEGNKKIEAVGGQDGGTSWNSYEVGDNKKLTPLAIEEGMGRDKSLVGYWSFDEGSGNIAKDYSGNNNHGTLYSSTTICSNPPTSGCPQWVDGKVGKALQFTQASNQQVIVNDPVSLRVNNYSIIFYIKFLAGPDGGWRQILAKHTNCSSWSNRSPGIWINHSYIGLHWKHSPDNSGPEALGFNGEDTNFNTSTSFFYFIAGSKNGPVLKLKFIDGSGTEKNYTYSVIDPMCQGPGNFYIGATGYASQGMIIDEVRIYNRALSDAEIKALYEATK